MTDEPKRKPGRPANGTKSYIVNLPPEMVAELDALPPVGPKERSAKIRDLIARGLPPPPARSHR